MSRRAHEERPRKRGGTQGDGQRPVTDGTAASGQPRSFRLPCGLEVVLQVQRSSPVVAFQAWVGVGSADEPEEIAGIAHVFEHMLFKGTERRGVGRIAQEMEGAGGEINAWTSFDQTVYHLVLASRFFDTGLDILTDAIRRSSFDPVELERELKVVLEEIKQGEDAPGRLVTQALFSTAYARHPYRRAVIGSRDTVSRFRRPMLVDFFRRHYVPDNITLVVVGDFDPDEARRRIEAAWSDARPGRPRREALQARRARRRLELRDRPQRGPRAKVVTHRVGEAHVVLGFRIPELAHADTPALDLAALVLGQGDSSRLQVDVRRRRQLVNDVYAYAFTPEDPGLFVVGATCPPDQVDAALDALLDETLRLGREPVELRELEKAQANIESDAVYQRETVQGMARKLGFFATVARSLDFEADYFRRVRAETPESLRDAASRHLRAATCTVAVMVPEGSPEGSKNGKSAKRKAVKSAPREAELRARVQAAEERARAMGPATPAPRPSRATRATTPAVVREVLPGGARVLVLPDPSVQLVALRGVWRGGLLDETPEDNGISNLLAGLFVRGTTARRGDEIAGNVSLRVPAPKVN